VHAGNAAELLALANVACVGGSWLTPADALAQADWDRVSRLAAEARALPRD
jgi:2-dehydro-3-deoxyphosphogluconate aldolase/(4S)-4-hydroxy-2-oxoglutarate aldolase